MRFHMKKVRNIDDIETDYQQLEHRRRELEAKTSAQNLFRKRKTVDDLNVDDGETPDIQISHDAISISIPGISTSVSSDRNKKKANIQNQQQQQLQRSSSDKQINKNVAAATQQQQQQQQQSKRRRSSSLAGIPGLRRSSSLMATAATSTLRRGSSASGSGTNFNIAGGVGGDQNKTRGSQHSVINPDEDYDELIGDVLCSGRHSPGHSGCIVCNKRYGVAEHLRKKQKSHLSRKVDLNTLDLGGGNNSFGTSVRFASSFAAVASGGGHISPPVSPNINSLPASPSRRGTGVNLAASLNPSLPPSQQQQQQQQSPETSTAVFLKHRAPLVTVPAKSTEWREIIGEEDEPIDEPWKQDLLQKSERKRKQKEQTKLRRRMSFLSGGMKAMIGDTGTANKMQYKAALNLAVSSSEGSSSDDDFGGGNSNSNSTIARVQSGVTRQQQQQEAATSDFFADDDSDQGEEQQQQQQGGEKQDPLIQTASFGEFVAFGGNDEEGVAAESSLKEQSQESPSSTFVEHEKQHNLHHFHHESHIRFQEQNGDEESEPQQQKPAPLQRRTTASFIDLSSPTKTATTADANKTDDEEEQQKQQKQEEQKQEEQETTTTTMRRRNSMSASSSTFSKLRRRGSVSYGKDWSSTIHLKCPQGYDVDCTRPRLPLFPEDDTDLEEFENKVLSSGCFGSDSATSIIRKTLIQNEVDPPIPLDEYLLHPEQQYQHDHLFESKGSFLSMEHSQNFGSSVHPSQQQQQQTGSFGGGGSFGGRPAGKRSPANIRFIEEDTSFSSQKELGSSINRVGGVRSPQSTSSTASSPRSKSLIYQQQQAQQPSISTVHFMGSLEQPAASSSATISSPLLKPKLDSFFGFGDGEQQQQQPQQNDYYLPEMEVSLRSYNSREIDRAKILAQKELERRNEIEIKTQQEQQRVAEGCYQDEKYLEKRTRFNVSRFESTLPSALAPSVFAVVLKNEEYENNIIAKENDDDDDEKIDSSNKKKSRSISPKNKIDDEEEEEQKQKTDPDVEKKNQQEESQQQQKPFDATLAPSTLTMLPTSSSSSSSAFPHRHRHVINDISPNDPRLDIITVDALRATQAHTCSNNDNTVSTEKATMLRGSTWFSGTDHLSKASSSSASSSARKQGGGIIKKQQQQQQQEAEGAPDWLYKSRYRAIRQNTSTPNGLCSSARRKKGLMVGGQMMFSQHNNSNSSNMMLTPTPPPPSSSSLSQKNLDDDKNEISDFYICVRLVRTRLQNASLSSWIFNAEISQQGFLEEDNCNNMKMESSSSNKGRTEEEEKEKQEKEQQHHRYLWEGLTLDSESFLLFHRFGSSSSSAQNVNHDGTTTTSSENRKARILSPFEDLPWLTGKPFSELKGKQLRIQVVVVHPITEKVVDSIVQF